MKSAAIVASAAAAAFGAGGCLFDDDKLCTLVGAPSGLNLEVSLADPTFAGSVYDVIVRADGAELSIRRDFGMAQSCTATPPSPMVAFGCLAEVDTGEHLIWLQAGLSETSGTIVIDYGRGELGGPATAEVEVRKNDVSLVTRTYSPAYEVVEPNGPGCGQSAYAFDDLAIVAP